MDEKSNQDDPAPKQSDVPEDAGHPNPPVEQQIDPNEDPNDKGLCSVFLRLDFF